MGRYSMGTFRDAKNNMFDMVDGLTDAQRDIVTTGGYLNKQLAFMTKRMSNLEWKFQLKYSTRVTSRCIDDAEVMEKNFNDLKAIEGKIQKDWMKVSSAFAEGAKKDLALWDCAAMYPTPKKTTVNTWELITGFAKKGFEVFNQVKGLLPEGTMDKIKIPGLPGGITPIIDGAQQITDMFGKGQEEELTELGFIGGDTKATWAERQRLHAEAIGMCRAEHDTFAKTIDDISTSASGFARRSAFKNFSDYPTAQAAIDEYNSGAKSNASGSMSSSEQTKIGIMQSNTADAFTKMWELAKHNQAKSLKLKAKLIE